MADENFIEKVASSLGQNASVKNVFGEPILVGDKTIVPVARLAYGFGGGFGKGKPRSKKEGSSENDSDTDEEKVGKGAGGGGGFNATAKGVYEITPTCTRFIPANANKQILLGVAIGYLVKKFFFSKSKKSKG